VAAQFTINLSAEAAYDGVPGHGENSPELGIGKECDVLNGESEVDPALEGEAHETHGLRGHADDLELGVGDAHGLELPAVGSEADDVGEVPVQVLDGVGGPVEELDGVPGLAARVEDPEPDVGLDSPELLGADAPLHEPVKIDRLIFLDVSPA